MAAEVVTLRGYTLKDVPALLRNLADQIETGKYGEHAQVVCVVPKPDDYPDVYSMGDIEVAETLMVLDLAKMFMLTALVR